MLNGWFRGKRTGSGTIMWTAREMFAKGEIDYAGMIDLVASSAPSTGYCNTMGTATTMNSLAEALGMQLPGSAAIPAPYRDRGEMAWRVGKRAVEIVHEDLKPSDIMTRGAFLNAIKVNSAIGGSTNAPIHLNAIARHLGVELSIEDWQTHGEEIPLLVNLQPAGEYLGEDYYHAGGVPAVFGQLIEKELIDESVMTISGKTVGECYRGVVITDEQVIRPFDTPLKENAGFRVLTGNIFHSAVMKMSVVSPEFRARYLANPARPNRFEGRAVVFDGPEDYHARIDDPALAIDENTMLFMRGAGPKGYPGAAEVVNMRAPDYLLKQGITSLVCIGDGRQSGTSGSPSILNGSPEAASGGALALIETGDHVVLDLNQNRLDLLVDDAEIARRRTRLEATGGYQYPAHQTPWQEIQRSLVGELETGAVLEPAVKYQRIAQTKGIPRDNH
jgi:dihydroxy-acid dehydratase